MIIFILQNNIKRQKLVLKRQNGKILIQNNIINKIILLI